MGRLDVRAILADPLTRSKNSRAIARENREFARDSRQLDPPRGPVVALKWFTHRPNGELRAVTQEGHTCQVVPVGTWRTVKGKQVESVAYLARIYLKGETGMVQVHRRDAHGAKTPYFLWVGKAKLACMHWLLRRADGRGSDECP